MRQLYRNAMCLLVLTLLSASVTAQTTTTTTIVGDMTRTETYDASGNLISWSSGPTASAPTAVATPVATTPLMSVDGSTDAGLATTSTTSTTDGGPMTIANHPTPQPPQTTQPQATPAPQAPQTQPPQPTPAPQPPQTPPTTRPVPTTQTPKPTQVTTPQPTTAKPAAVVSTAAPTEAPTAPANTELPATSVPPSSTMPTTSAAPASSIPPATSVAPAGANPANTTAPAGTTETPKATMPTDAASQTTEEPKTSETPSASKADETAQPLSEASGTSNGRSGSSGRGNGSWGVVVAVAGVICAIVGISAFALVTRRRKMELNDAKASNDNLDFEDGTTPADARPGQNASHAAAPPPAAAMSPQRVSYDFRRASDAPAPRGPALATPVDTMSAMPSRQSRAASAPTRQSRAGSFPIVTRQSRTASMAPVSAHHTPATGSVLATRESEESRMSSFYCESNDSFISSASVAPPLPPADGFEAAALGASSSSDASSTDFTPTDSFVMATAAAKMSMNDSIVSSNMEYEFCDDSFQPVAGNSYRTTATNLNRGTVTGSIPSASFNILDKDAAEFTGKSSYDYGDDQLSEDGDGDMDEAIDFETASENSFTQTFYEPRDDSYSDDYARGSAADSAIRGSTDSLFSRSSSEFSERKTDDSLA